MNFILDENFPRTAIVLLKEKGHSAKSVLEFSQKGSDDVALFQLAQKENAVFLTTDKDFYHTVPLLFENHSGVVVIALHQPNREKILSRLDWVLRWLQQGSVAGKVLLVGDHQHLIAP